jgi:DNA-binding GntR family transcriptional regulator
VNSRQSVRDQVAENLRSALVTGRLRPGERYSAPRLAQELGVSATPVREAMLDFVRLGWVEVEANAGFRVVEPSTRALDDMLELRLLIEVPTMGEIAAACEGETAEAVEALRPLARDLVAAAEEGDLVRYVTDDIDFHAGFLDLHGNARLTEFVSELRGSSRLFGLSALAAAGNLVETTREHERMIDLALARDREGMEALVRRHLGHTRGIWAVGGR